MVDENETNNASESTQIEESGAAPEAKKQRAKRRTPAELAAVAAAKSQKAISRKAASPTEASKPTVASKAPSTKSKISAPAQAEAPKGAVSSQTPPAAVDEFADLLQLEEENRSLRKALSEKLRAENADLRKRLGQA